MAIEVRNIVKRFGSFAALDNVDLKVADGELLALLGPSGSGKTTLLRIIAGLDWPDSGEVAIDGENALSRGASERQVGFVFQHYALFRHMTVFDNVAFGLRNKKVGKSAARTQAQEALELVGLADQVGKYVHQMSGGQQQRLSIARVIATGPDVLLLDEPCSAIDPISSAKIEQTIDELKRDHAIIIVTHNLQQAARVSDFAGFMYLGELVEFGDRKSVV